jgi:hypothetical protein
LLKVYSSPEDSSHIDKKYFYGSLNLVNEQWEFHVGTLEIDGHELQTSNIDFVLQKDVDSAPGMIIHQCCGTTDSCIFPNEEDRSTGWELVRIALADEEFYEFPGALFRLEAIVAAIVDENPTDGPYIQMGFRGGMLLRRPFRNKTDRDIDFAALEKLLGNRPHALQ